MYVYIYILDDIPIERHDYVIVHARVLTPAVHPCDFIFEIKLRLNEMFVLYSMDDYFLKLFHNFYILEIYRKVRLKWI